jgi:hypothetical protein
VRFENSLKRFSVKSSMMPASVVNNYLSWISGNNLELRGRCTLTVLEVTLAQPLSQVPSNVVDANMLGEDYAIQAVEAIENVAF